MVPISDVKKLNVSKGRFNEANIARLTEDPRGVTHSVFGGEIYLRLAARLFLDEGLQFPHRPINQKYGAGLGVKRVDMPQAILFFVWPCEFVFLDQALQIFLAARHRGQADLPVLAERLAIEIKTGVRVLPKSPVRNEERKILLGFCIDTRVVKVDGGRQVNFRFADMKET